MSSRDLTKLLETFRQMPDEVEWLEFKEAKTSYDTEKVGQYFAALANEANLKGKSEGWLILGVHDKKRDAAGRRIIVGTEFRKDVHAQNELKKYIADHTPYRTTFRDIHELTVDGKRVLMLEIPAASPGTPMTWKGHLYGREGASLGSLSLVELDQNSWPEQRLVC